MTTNPAAASAWLRDQPSGVEGVAAKKRDQRYCLGAPGWQKLRSQRTAEAVIGGVLDTLERSDALFAHAVESGQPSRSHGNRPIASSVKLRMTDLAPNRRHRDPVTALFATALNGDVSAEHELGELAVLDDRAAEALCALVCSEVVAMPDARPSDVAATDQMIAAVLEAVASTPQSGMSGSC